MNDDTPTTFDANATAELLDRIVVLMEDYGVAALDLYLGEDGLLKGNVTVVGHQVVEDRGLLEEVYQRRANARAPANTLQVTRSGLGIDHEYDVELRQNPTPREPVLQSAKAAS